MRQLLTAIVMILLNSGIAAASGEWKRHIDRLDAALDSRELYIQLKERQLDSLKQLSRLTADPAARYQIYSQLTQESMNYSLDSALVAAKQALALATSIGNDSLMADARINVAHIYNSTALMTKEALEIVQSLDGHTWHGEAQLKFYILKLQVFSSLAGQSFDPEVTRRYRAVAQLYRDSVLVLQPDNEIILANKYISEGNYEKARATVAQGLDESDETTQAAARHHVLARIYGLQDNDEMRKQHLAQAARCDMVNGVREYMALQELAQMLYDDGDIGRAYRYIHQSIADAIACNARQRMLQMSKSLPIIDADYERKTADTNRMLYVACVVIGLLSVLLLVVAIYVHKRNHKLAAAKLRQEELNKQLEQSNDNQQQLNQQLLKLNDELRMANQKWAVLNEELQHANRIKGEYITQFVNLCSDYLAKLERYRNNLQKIAGQRNFDLLYDAIKSTKLIDKEIGDFYAKFDEAFLHLFPNFVEEFNSLLQPECQVKLKKGERLNTELRIFALYRLGFADNDQVADFLRISSLTIYNYRTKMRNRARDRQNFETGVMSL